MGEYKYPGISNILKPAFDAIEPRVKELISNDSEMQELIMDTVEIDKYMSIDSDNKGITIKKKGLVPIAVGVSTGAVYSMDYSANIARYERNKITFSVGRTAGSSFDNHISFSNAINHIRFAIKGTLSQDVNFSLINPLYYIGYNATMGKYQISIYNCIPVAFCIKYSDSTEHLFIDYKNNKIRMDTGESLEQYTLATIDGTDVNDIMPYVVIRGFNSYEDAEKACCFKYIRYFKDYLSKPTSNTTGNLVDKDSVFDKINWYHVLCSEGEGLNVVDSSDKFNDILPSNGVKFIVCYDLSLIGILVKGGNKYYLNALICDGMFTYESTTPTVSLDDVMEYCSGLIEGDTTDYHNVLYLNTNKYIHNVTVKDQSNNTHKLAIINRHSASLANIELYRALGFNPYDNDDYITCDEVYYCQHVDYGIDGRVPVSAGLQSTDLDLVFVEPFTASGVVHVVLNYDAAIISDNVILYRD